MNEAHKKEKNEYVGIEYDPVTFFSHVSTKNNKKDEKKKQSCRSSFKTLKKKFYPQMNMENHALTLTRCGREKKKTT